MPDKFTDVTTVGYGKRIMDSIGGIVVGLILFIASFFVLYNNEGSFDYSQIAKTAVQISASQEVTDPALKDKLVVTSGLLESDELIDDGLYLKPWKYLALESKGEMYAWVEKKSTSTQKNIGGSETKTTTYDYAKEWTANPADSSTFAHPDGHSNPPMMFTNVSKRVSKATLGIFNVQMQSISLPALTPLALNSEKTNIQLVPPATGSQISAGIGTQQTTSQQTAPMHGSVQLIGSDYIYVTADGSTYSTPIVGDLRISYSVLYGGTDVTIFGKLNEKTFVPFVDNDNHKLFQIFLGTKDEAISELHESFVMWKWIWRGIGFAMMWFGLSMILGPISVLADVLPILGSISGSIIGVVTFIAALVLSGVTILIAMVFHSVVALVVAVIAIVAAGYFILRGKSKPPNTARPQ